MNLSEIQNNLPDINQINSLTDCGEYNYSLGFNFLRLNNLIVHKIELLNNSFDTSVLNTTIELDGATIGDIFYLKGLELDISSLNDYQFIVFLVECEISDIILPKYRFKNNYLLIHKDHIDIFHYKYSFTSSVWGGFKIAEAINSINYYKKQITNIVIPEELNELNSYAQDSIFRALDQKHSFERFLKLYHLLELEFDYSLIKKIKSLDIINDSNKIGELLNEYNRTELDRLTDLISNQCNDISGLALKLNEISNFKTIGEDIFIKFGKSKNTAMLLTDPICYNALLNDPAKFTSDVSVHNFAKVQKVNYNKFIYNITAYWIYRIRCSIAHFKIGEYILTRDKEEFIVEFAEPLIKEVLIQFYKK